jgi:hypothetical protein
MAVESPEHHPDRVETIDISVNLEPQGNLDLRIHTDRFPSPWRARRGALVDADKFWNGRVIELDTHTSIRFAPEASSRAAHLYFERLDLVANGTRNATAEVLSRLFGEKLYARVREIADIFDGILTGPVRSESDLDAVLSQIPEGLSAQDHAFGTFEFARDSGGLILGAVFDQYYELPHALVTEQNQNNRSNDFFEQRILLQGNSVIDRTRLSQPPTLQ